MVKLWKGGSHLTIPFFFVNKFGRLKTNQYLCITINNNNNMKQTEYNNWWFDYYCEMGVEGFNDPRDNDEDYYDYYRERQEELFNESFNNYFKSLLDY